MKKKQELLREANAIFAKFYKLNSPENRYGKMSPPDFTNLTTNYVRYDLDTTDYKNLIIEYGCLKKKEGEAAQADYDCILPHLSLCDQKKNTINLIRSGLLNTCYHRIVGSIEVSTRNNIFKINFECKKTENNTEINIPNNSRNLTHFTVEFLEFFFYFFLREKQIMFHEWNVWDIIVSQNK